MFRNSARTAVLLAALGGVMVGIGSLFGRGGAILGLILGLAVVGFSYWKSDSLAIRSARAVPADEARFPEYYAIMRELTDRAQMPMPRLYVSPEAQPNAFATGRNPDHAAVAVTAGLLQVCSWDEVRGVLAHELEKPDAYTARVPMTIAPAQASHFIINPLTGHSAGFANLFRTHPTTEERVARLRGSHV